MNASDEARGLWRLLVGSVVVALAVTLATFGLVVTKASGGSPPGLKTITAVPGDHDQNPLPCTGRDGVTNQVLFTISGIDTLADVPAVITVDVVGEGTLQFPSFPPGPHQSGLAVYRGPAPNGVTKATAQIYAAWEGVFQLEEYYCGPGQPPTTTTTSTVPVTTTTVPPSTTTIPPPTTTTTPGHVTPPPPTPEPVGPAGPPPNAPLPAVVSGPGPVSQGNG